MNKQPTLELDRRVPERTAAILAALPNLGVKRNRQMSRLLLDGSSWPVVVVAAGRRPDDGILSLLSTPSGDDRLAMVVAELVPERMRRTLEISGAAYADATGAIHIERPGLLLHVEPRRARESAQLAPPKGIGVVGVRVVQALLGDAGQEWAVHTLADAAGSSTGEAHRILTTLEADGLVTVTGKGPARRRRVANASALLDWLAAIPSARRIRERQRAFLYASNPDELLSRVAKRAGGADIAYAVTGTAAAGLLGARVISAIPQVMIRVDPDVDLHQVAETLGAEGVDSGANLLLVRDLGRLGVHARVETGPVAVAPPVRVWLDMLGELRGEDAAALFRETVLG